MRLIDADAMYERFVKKREGLDGIYDAIDLPDMLGDMPTVEAIPIEWLKQKYRENDPDSGNEDYDFYMWECSDYIMAVWNEEQEEE